MWTSKYAGADVPPALRRATTRYVADRSPIWAPRTIRAETTFASNPPPPCLNALFSKLFRQRASSGLAPVRKSPTAWRLVAYTSTFEAISAPACACSNFDFALPVIVKAEKSGFQPGQRVGSSLPDSEGVRRQPEPRSERLTTPLRARAMSRGFRRSFSARGSRPAAGEPTATTAAIKSTDEAA